MGNLNITTGRDSGLVIPVSQPKSGVAVNSLSATPQLQNKMFYIVTKKDEEVKEFILKYLNHGVTIFKGKGGYSKNNENVLMAVLPTKDYYRLKEGINEIDKDAFFIVTDSYEVFGGE